MIDMPNVIVNAALRVADQIDRLGEARAKRAAQGGGERVDTAALRFQCAECGFDAVGNGAG